MTFKKTIFTAISAVAILAGGTLAVATLGGTHATAQAQSSKSVIKAAKARGVIGETAAGYLAETGSGSVSAAERAAMNEVNIGRKSVYTRLARDQNQPLTRLSGFFYESSIPIGEND